MAGAVVAFLLLLLLHWPTRDSDSELRLAMAFALAPFPLSMVAALLARLPAWPIVGLLAPFAMLTVVCALLFGKTVGSPAVDALKGDTVA